LQRGPEEISATIESRHDSSDRLADDHSNLLVGEPFDLPEFHDLSHNGGEAPDRFSDFFDSEATKKDLLGV
jgi:hypothetical protein